jgi:hypothetical protein
MKAIMGVGLFVFIVTGGAFAAESTDLEAIKAELKPLRVKAYKEPDVKAAREKLDAAYREYWDVVRKAMIRLEPDKKALIEADVDSRKAKSAIAGEPAQKSTE